MQQILPAHAQNQGDTTIGALHADAARAGRAYWRTEDLQVRRRDLLGGLIHEYELAAAA